ncbi:hypothetical protein MIND_01047700 [Mycena indigotica]|uniref:Uncharacterized protein n=1 Tax=Mycena indigotica TaxID=2126181 RepID=A0A8H6VV55_9AGAR|nr:uncharacterized protein MIND_01047700 [Mycena indigotica]KAF7295094.1 hypothetical protein MIND_01047700 [Mycena indigotica]
MKRNSFHDNSALVQALSLRPHSLRKTQNLTRFARRILRKEGITTSRRQISATVRDVLAKTCAVRSKPPLPSLAVRRLKNQSALLSFKAPPPSLISPSNFRTPLTPRNQSPFIPLKATPKRIPCHIDENSSPVFSSPQSPVFHLTKQFSRVFLSRSQQISRRLSYSQNRTSTSSPEQQKGLTLASPVLLRSTSSFWRTTTHDVASPCYELDELSFSPFQFDSSTVEHFQFTQYKPNKIHCGSPDRFLLIMTSTNKTTLASVLPTLRPTIKRRHLRKYSWLPDVFRLKGSIISRIFGPVITVTLFATAVAYADHRGHTMSLSNSIVPMLSVVVGLILVFRNGTSYDRYWEGRKCFGTLCSNVRNLSRLIWINVALPPTDEQPAFAKGKTPTSEVTAHQLYRRKKEALHLCLSFVYATKHYLRGEDGMHWDDYKGVLPTSFVRSDETGYNTQHTTPGGTYAATAMAGSLSALSGKSTDTLNKGDATKRVRAKRSKHDMTSANTPLLAGTHRTVEFHPFADDASMPLPLVIGHEITRLLFLFRREGFLETVGPAGTNAMTGLVQSMTDQLTSMERVANTPIPVSYGIHLKQCVTLYLFALPMTLVKELGWAMIPLVTVVAFTFMGIEGIAQEIEDPFGTDYGDLPLDRYCHDLKEEIDYLLHRLPEGGMGSHGYDDGEGDD